MQAQPIATPQQLNGCVAGAEVVWWPIAGQGHLAWSCGANPLWHDQGIWSFFTHDAAPSDTSCP